MDEALFVAACVALGGAGWRAAAACGLDGLLRAVGAAALAVAAATLTALALGVAGLSGSAPVLALAALAAWLLAARALPAAGSPVDAARAGWRALGRAERLGAAAALAVALGWAGWQAQHPNLGFDGLVYHTNLAAIWAQTGHTGSVLDVAYGLPVGNYPLANEASLAWALGVSHALVLASLWSVALAGLLAAAVLAGLARAGVAPLERRLAAATLVALPIVVQQLRGPYSDLAAASWLAACLALCAAVRAGAPRALIPALLAGGMAAGAKTTAALVALVALAITAWPLRRSLAPRVALGGAAAGAAVLGGLWPLRNLLEHGAPLWPLSSAPGGDAVPRAFTLVDDRFADHAGTLLRHDLGDYAKVLGGGWVLLGAAIVLPWVTGRRGARAGALATVAGLALWAVSPYTGALRVDLAVGATRYLLPTLVLAALALAGCGRAGAVALAAAALVSAGEVAGTFGGPPDTPGAGTLLALALAGAVAALAWERRPRGRRRIPPRAAWAAGALVAWVWLAALTTGYVARHEQTLQRIRRTQTTVTGWVDGDPRFYAGRQPVTMFPLTLAILAGDHLHHPLRKVPDREPCAATRARTRTGWVVVQASSRALLGCLRGLPARGQGSDWFVFGPG